MIYPGLVLASIVLSTFFGWAAYVIAFRNGRSALWWFFFGAIFWFAGVATCYMMGKPLSEKEEYHDSIT